MKSKESDTGKLIIFILGVVCLALSASLYSDGIRNLYAGWADINTAYNDITFLNLFNESFEGYLECNDKECMKIHETYGNGTDNVFKSRRKFALSGIFFALGIFLVSYNNLWVFKNE